MPLLALLASVALLATACIRVEIGIQVNEDGSGEVSIVSALSRDLPGAGLDELLGGLDTSELPADATVEEFDDGEFRGIRVVTPFGSVEEFDPNRQLGGVTVDDGSQFLLEELDGGGWLFEAVLPVDVGQTGVDIDLTPLLLENAVFIFSVDLPGEITETNADDVSGGRAEWDLLTRLDEPTVTLFAESRPGGSGNSRVGPIVAVVFLVLVAGAIGGFLIWRTSRRPDFAAPVEPPPDPDPGSTPPAPPDGATDLRYDDARRTWLAYDRANESWLQHDAATGEWRQIDS